MAAVSESLDRPQVVASPAAQVSNELACGAVPILGEDMLGEHVNLMLDGT